jgi:hypothetical protein
MKWKKEPHISTPPMTTTDKGQKRRYTNIPLGTKDRSGHSTPNQLTGLRNAKFATSMRLAMRITQALHRPAADFVYVAEW